jgi:hypothetical protein
MYFFSFRVKSQTIDFHTIDKCKNRDHAVPASLIEGEYLSSIEYFSARYHQKHLLNPLEYLDGKTSTSSDKRG